MRPARLLLLAVGTALLAGCSCERAKTVPELRDAAVAARAEATAARAGKDAKQAGRAADRAERAAERAAALIEAMDEPTDADRAASDEAAEAAREARHAADLAEEERRLAKLLGGLKARAYRGARNAALSATFAGLALAADQAAKASPDQLPETVRDAADLAAQVAEHLAGRDRLPDGQPDWPGIAADLRGFRAQPPPELGLYLAVAFLGSGRTGLALVEIQAVDPATLPTTEMQDLAVALRLVAYAMNDMPELALIEMQKLSDAADGRDYGPETLGSIHLVAALLYLDRRDYRRADVEIVRAMKTWPNNPVSVFLTGERLAADGKYEEAAESLEKAAAGTDLDWLARKIADRARQLRDRKGETEPLLHDPAFLRDVLLRTLFEAAKDSQPAQRLRGWLDSAQGFGRRLLDKLPGRGPTESGG
jgi:hypothetical protein